MINYDSLVKSLVKRVHMAINHNKMKKKMKFLVF